MSDRTCSVPDCERPAKHRGFCKPCYERKRYRGELQLLPPREKVACSILDCTRVATCKGYCSNHYSNLAHYGHAVARRDWPLIARIAEVGWDETPRGCWEWRGARNEHGYGLIAAPRILGGGRARVHRLMWEMHNGPLGDDFEIRHRCDNPPCVNPGHLELGTHSDNMRDMSERQRSRAYSTGRYDGVCVKGLHDVTQPGALRTLHRKGRSSETICTQCDRDRKRRWEQRKRETA